MIPSLPSAEVLSSLSLCTRLGRVGWRLTLKFPMVEPFSYLGLDDGDFMGHLSNSSYARVSR